jgi:acyl-CoA synthetase (AMP-forming)/AMP-acid ligase II
MERAVLPWRNVGELLDAAADRYGSRTLFIFEGERVSFAEARRRVDAAAHALRRLGVAQGERVSLLLPNSPAFPILWLALARIGAVAVPTNPAYQARDLAFVLRDSGAAAIVLHADYLPQLAAVRDELPALRCVAVLGGDVPAGYSDFAALCAHGAGEPLNSTVVDEEDLLNLQYTSGTTGFPKGCMLTHRYWLLLGHLAGEHLRVRDDDVNLTAQPFFYMDPQWNTALCLIHGIPLVILPRFSASGFWPAINAHGVSFCYLLGTMPFFLLKQPENPALEQGHRLRVIMCSGIHPQYHAIFEQRWRVPWREAFGMTETGVDLVVALDDAASVGSGIMGVPVRTKEARVVGPDGQPLPPGMPGELVVRGEPMMQGYWGQPEATARTLVDGWLHTGDLVIQNQNGAFLWQARLKDMVRRGGENIAAAEVEAVLLEHPAVALAAVVPVPDALRGEEVKAYLVLRPGHTPLSAPPEALAAFVRERLAAFKVPRYIEYAADLPRTPSEKVAKPALITAKADLRTGSYDLAERRWC